VGAGVGGGFGEDGALDVAAVQLQQALGRQCEEARCVRKVAGHEGLDAEDEREDYLRGGAVAVCGAVAESVHQTRHGVTVAGAGQQEGGVRRVEGAAGVGEDRLGEGARGTPG
jgi:hypothetical protein